MGKAKHKAVTLKEALGSNPLPPVQGLPRRRAVTLEEALKYVAPYRMPGVRRGG